MSAFPLLGVRFQGSEDAIGGVLVHPAMVVLSELSEQSQNVRLDLNRVHLSLLSGLMPLCLDAFQLLLEVVGLDGVDN